MHANDSSFHLESFKVKSHYVRMKRSNEDEVSPVKISRTLRMVILCTRKHPPLSSVVNSTVQSPEMEHVALDAKVMKTKRTVRG